MKKLALIVLTAAFVTAGSINAQQDQQAVKKDTTKKEACTKEQKKECTKEGKKESCCKKDEKK